MITGPVNVCRACGAQPVRPFYEVRNVPVQSVLLFPTREEALSMPRGDILLAFCPACGFVGNQLFDPDLIEFSSRYEETQGFSATFTAFHRDLAERIITRFDLHGRTILEIGCGKGEFLTMLCEMGNNTGIGFDPVYDEKRTVSPARDRLTFYKQFYGEQHAGIAADFVACKMTLEHIAAPFAFLRMIRQTLGGRRSTRVFFQVPEVTKIFREEAFWDVYYEHCSYFSPGSLSGVFRRSGFTVHSVWTEYDDQYLMIDAVPGAAPDMTTDAGLLDEIRAAVEHFSTRVAATNRNWDEYVRAQAALGRRMVLWGAGSKGVGFLTTLQARDAIQYAVDVNPHKHGTFLAGTGQEIIAPAALQEYRPDLVFVMNPIYCDEIGATLRGMGVAAELIPLGENV